MIPVPFTGVLTASTVVYPMCMNIVARYNMSIALWEIQKVVTHLRQTSEAASTAAKVGLVAGIGYLAVGAVAVFSGPVGWLAVPLIGAMVAKEATASAAAATMVIAIGGTIKEMSRRLWLAGFDGKEINYTQMMGVMSDEEQGDLMQKLEQRAAKMTTSTVEDEELRLVSDVKEELIVSLPPINPTTWTVKKKGLIINCTMKVEPAKLQIFIGDHKCQNEEDEDDKATMSFAFPGRYSGLPTKMLIRIIHDGKEITYPDGFEWVPAQ